MLTRRGCLIALSVPAALVLTRSLAQGSNWREYRRDDFGFRIELPDEPEVEETKQENADEDLIRMIEVEVESDGVRYSVWCEEHRSAVDPDQKFAHTADVVMRHVPGVRLTGARLLQMRYPAAEFVAEPDPAGGDDPVFWTMREVVAGKIVIAYNAMSKERLTGNPAVQRFFESFMFLPAGR